MDQEWQAWTGPTVVVAGEGCATVSAENRGRSAAFGIVRPMGWDQSAGHKVKVRYRIDQSRRDALPLFAAEAAFAADAGPLFQGTRMPRYICWSRGGLPTTIGAVLPLSRE